MYKLRYISSEGDGHHVKGDGHYVKWYGHHVKGDGHHVRGDGHNVLRAYITYKGGTDIHKYGYI